MQKGVVFAICLCLLACSRNAVHDAQSPSPLHLAEPSAVIETALPPQVLEDVEVDIAAPSVASQRPSIPSVLVNLWVQNAPIQEVLQGLAKDSGVNMDVHPQLQGTVTLHAVKQSIPAILSRMAKQVELRYEWVNGGWLIAPDTPQIRIYRVNYVNMARDTSGYIGAASEIGGAVKVSNTSSGQAGNNGAGSTNSSRTAVASQSRYHLWETIVQNLHALLEETNQSQTEPNPSVVTFNAPLTHATPDASGLIPPSPPTSTDALSSMASSMPQAAQAATLPRPIQKLTARLIANPETGILTIKATHRQHQQVKAYLQSVMRVATRQVLIEATIVEVELSRAFQMGIDWSRMSASVPQRGWVFAQSLGNKAAQFSTTTGQFESNNTKNALGQNNGNSALLLGYLNPLSGLGSLAASVTLLEQFGQTRVISSPKLMALNNQTAVLKVVDNLVYFTLQSQISQSNSNTGSNLQSITTTANTVPVGLVMAVTAQINSQQQVNLHVRPTVSKVLRYIEDPNPQLGAGSSRIISSIPEIQVREMESVLHVASGQIAVLGGLMQDDQRDLNDSVPGVSKLPLVGQAFRGSNRASKKTELVVFLRPTVIREADVKQGDLQAFGDLLPERLPPLEDSDAETQAEPQGAP